MERKIRDLVPKYLEALRGGRQVSFVEMLRSACGHSVHLQLSGKGVIISILANGGYVKVATHSCTDFRKMLGNEGVSTVSVDGELRKLPITLIFKRKALVNGYATLCAKKCASEELTSRRGAGSRPGRRLYRRAPIELPVSNNH